MIHGWIITLSTLGYGAYYDDDPETLEANAFKMVPPISLTFYSFHIMVALGMWFFITFYYSTIPYL